jgi:hypothetical protein
MAFIEIVPAFVAAAAALIAALHASATRAAVTHLTVEVNHRLSQLLESRSAEARGEGRAAGIEQERNRDAAGNH